MSYKKTKIKIKRSRVNLYNKRKNRKKQIIAIVITAAAACALCILGYGIGKPLMDYFRGQGIQSSSSVWTPEGSVGSENPPDSSSAGGSTESSSVEENPPEPVQTNTAFFLSEDAALSSAALNSELAVAKSTGHSVVVVTLKNSDGVFLYKSNIERVKSNGALTAAQIADTIQKAGFIPAAKISTIKDKSNGIALGCHYKFADGGTWLDNRPGIGKTWLSPFDDKTLDFIKQITSELSQAGFKRIIAAETMLPVFFPVDITQNLSHLPLSDRQKRADALWNVIAAAKEGAEVGGAELFVEMEGEKMLLAKKDGTDAELAFDVQMLKTANLLVDYTPSNSADTAYSAAQTFIENLEKTLDGAECTVRIKGSFSPAVIENVQKAFDEAEISAFSQ